MNEAAAKIGSVRLSSLSAAIRLPLVSALCEWPDTPHAALALVDSLRAQDYPRLEFLLADAGLPPDRAASFLDAVSGDTRFKIVPQQDGGILSLLDKCQGRFVAVIDGQTALPPHFISAHVQLHLAAAEPVAVSFERAPDMEAAGQEPGLLPASKAVRLDSIADTAFEAMRESARRFHPAEKRWLNAVSSRNLYRREALAILYKAGIGALTSIPLQAMLLPFSHFLGGSISIAGAEPVSTQSKDRDLEKRTQLSAVLSGAPHLTRYVPGRYWPAVLALMREEGSPPRAAFRRDDIQRLIAAQLPSLLAHFGTKRIVGSLIALAGPAPARRILLRSFGKIPVAAFWHLARAEFKRRFWMPVRNRLDTVGK